jgi:plastocyanin
MKRWLVYMLYGGVALVATVVVLVVPTIRAADTDVAIINFAFGPPTITIDVGDTVTWTNQDGTGHSATGVDFAAPAFDTGIIAPDTSRSVQFDKAGTFEYMCSPHPFMRGTVIVRGPTVSEQVYLPLVTR